MYVKLLHNNRIVHIDELIMMAMDPNNSTDSVRSVNYWGPFYTCAHCGWSWETYDVCPANPNQNCNNPDCSKKKYAIPNTKEPRQ